LSERTFVRTLPLDPAAARASHVPVEPQTYAGWRPTLGAWPEPDEARFRVWAPYASSIEVETEASGLPRRIRLQKCPDVTFGTLVSGVTAGARYRYRIDGGDPFPDPASRFQPQGVHGPSEVVDPASFVWTDEDWRGIARAELVLYAPIRAAWRRGDRSGVC
jgi:maltooligosyltrehalose trehalohydrolase